MSIGIYEIRFIAYKRSGVTIKFMKYSASYCKGQSFQVISNRHAVDT